MTRTAALAAIDAAIARATGADRETLIAYRPQMIAGWAREDAAAAQRAKCPTPWLGLTGTWL